MPPTHRRWKEGLEKIETKYTTYATCPYCGYEGLDSWEFDDGDYNCGSCDKLFTVVRDVDVSYLTYKSNNENCAPCPIENKPCDSQQVDCPNAISTDE